MSKKTPLLLKKKFFTEILYQKKISPVKKIYEIIYQKKFLPIKKKKFLTKFSIKKNFPC
jgi:hypothetical protein